MVVMDVVHKKLRDHGKVGNEKRGETSKSCLVCEKDHNTSKCDTWRNKATSKFEVFAQACHLTKRICLLCLEPGYPTFKCSSDDALRCPCKANLSVYICCKTPDCKSRKNWTDATTSILGYFEFQLKSIYQECY